MAFGMTRRAAPADFIDIVKFDANAGRLFRVDYNFASGEKTQVDITTPPPRFAIDLGSLEIGWAHFAATGPEFHLVPEGEPVPPQPPGLDDKGRPKFREAFRVKVYGKITDGLREWSSTAACVADAVDDLYQKFRDAPEAHEGKVPIVELTKTLPITTGRPPRQRTLYAPCFVIVGWTERVPAFGPRTVPPPKKRPPPDTTINYGPPSGGAPGGGSLRDELNDQIPFGPCVQ
jgi:hypothetical protein